MSVQYSGVSAQPSAQPPDGRLRIAVLKFGGSVLQDHADVVRAREEISRWRSAGYSVVAVVSALEGTTDALVAEADRFSTRSKIADGWAKAQLLATGELSAAALLGLELARAGLSAAVATPWSIGLHATGDAIDATPVSVDRERLALELSERHVVVVPGFIGIDDRRRVVLLGRGGSDLSAIFLASCLRAERCRLVKDVDGLYEYDPRGLGVRRGQVAPPRRFVRANWADALSLDGGIVQHKAVRCAQEHEMHFEVGAAGSTKPEDATLVGDVETLLAEARQRETLQV